MTSSHSQEADVVYSGGDILTMRGSTPEYVERRAVEHYASFGITTAAEKGVFTIDVVATPAFLMTREVVGNKDFPWRKYHNGLKFVGLNWTSVNQITRSGQVLGSSERVTHYEGLLALTADAAYEYFEESTKGTLESGKLADLVILDANPLKIQSEAIRDIQVVETIKAGKTLYQRSHGP
jgi:predicted amidohydrolase YtcJ